MIIIASGSLTREDLSKTFTFFLSSEGLFDLSSERSSLHQAAKRPGDQAKTLVTVHVSVTNPLHCLFPPLFLGLQTQCISYNPNALDAYTYPKQSDRFKFDWYCFHYFARNSLVALLESLFAREPEIDMITAKVAA